MEDQKSLKFHLRCGILRECMSTVSSYNSDDTAFEIDALVCITFPSGQKPLVVKVNTKMENLPHEVQSVAENFRVAADAVLCSGQELPSGTKRIKNKSEKNDTLKQNTLKRDECQNEVSHVRSSQDNGNLQRGNEDSADGGIRKRKIVEDPCETRTDPKKRKDSNVKEDGAKQPKKAQEGYEDPKGRETKKRNTEDGVKTYSELFLGKASLNTYLESRLECDICHVEFEFFRDLRNHNWEDHCRLTCEKCWRVFRDPEVYNYHVEQLCTCRPKTPQNAQAIPGSPKSWEGDNITTKDNFLSLLPDNIIAQMLKSDHSLNVQRQAMKTLKEDIDLK